MKLKKIASLALAGIMAVSMLAGCSNGTGSKDDGTAVVVSGMTGKVIAALDEDITDVVSFSSSTTLENLLKKAVQNAGTAFKTNITKNDLKNIENTLTINELPVAAAGTEKDAKNEKSYTFVMNMEKGDVGASAEYVANQLAARFDTFKVEDAAADNTMAKLDKNSVNYTKDETTYWYNYSYKAEMAVVEITDAVTGQTSYALACTITRTPTKVEK